MTSVAGSVATQLSPASPLIATPPGPNVTRTERARVTSTDYARRAPVAASAAGTAARIAGFVLIHDEGIGQPECVGSQVHPRPVVDEHAATGRPARSTVDQIRIDLGLQHDNARAHRTARNASSTCPALRWSFAPGITTIEFSPSGVTVIMATPVVAPGIVTTQSVRTPRRPSS